MTDIAGNNLVNTANLLDNQFYIASSSDQSDARFTDQGWVQLHKIISVAITFNF